ncbi:uncharacterized protein LOC134483819 isoform X3 [Rattus norvegicus]|uniref:uncharacterized protein LOC134483819 isoform X3 n=1 Tax=Rattus norvegicus TaxID=10116 RepID=UPI002FD7B573
MRCRSADADEWGWAGCVATSRSLSVGKPLSSWNCILCRMRGQNPSLKKTVQELKAGTSRQELTQRLHWSAACWLASHVLLSVYSYITQWRLTMGGTACSGVDTEIINQENVLQTTDLAIGICLRHFHH